MKREAILIIDDSPDIVELVAQQIDDLGFDSDVASDGQQGLEKALHGNYAMIVLDLTLPSLGGMEICRRLREAKTTTPILMLTSRAEDVDKILGLELGADDYMTKPFNVLELRARCRALIRRASTAAPENSDESDILRFNDLEINKSSHEVSVGGEVIELTPTEYGMLLLLASQPGRAISRDQLLESVLHSSLESYESNVTTHISRLRAKLAKFGGYEDCIKTVRGIGYRFIREDELPNRE